MDLVVAVGDLADKNPQQDTYTRALYSQDLYNAHIGFYPLRGNHEAANGSYTGSGADFMHAYPQIVAGSSAGVNNATPSDITTALIPALDLTLNPPAAKTCSRPFVVGTNFSGPVLANTANGSVSYSFQYRMRLST